MPSCTTMPAQWAGLFKGFYKPRWEMFLTAVDDCIRNDKVFEAEVVDDQIRAWEWEWVNSSEPYTDKPEGDLIVISKAMYEKYAAKLRSIYGIE